MFRSGFFLIRKQDGQKIPVPCSSYATAKRAGGATDSDVEVNTGKGKFQVECKLNYTSAEYFKYGLKVENGKLTYNHKKFLSGLYDGTDQIRQMLLNDYIFTEEIRIGDFINEIVKSSDVKKSWDLFNKNINDICDFLIKSDEYRPFSAGIGHLSKFPDDFE